MTPLLLTNLTATSQTILKIDSVCLSKEEARVIFKDLKLGQYCDSIRTNQSHRIAGYKGLVADKDEEINLHLDRVNTLEKEGKTKDAKIKILKKAVTFGLPVGVGVGALGMFLLLK